MDATPFKAMIVEETAEKTYVRKIAERSISDLPAGDVLIRVHYSSLNYKDALSATGNKGVTRKFPHTPGIDAAGVVEESADNKFKPGDPVIVTSYDLGMNTSGGFGRYIRVPSGWVVPLPDAMTLKESMIFGTAGITAGMSVWELEKHGVTPDSGDILVTGATGGVGSMAVAILSKAGYKVAAVTGKSDQAGFLKKLGASSVISRDDAVDTSKRPMLKASWAGVIDTVGGPILSTALKSCKPYGAVTCCGLVASPEFEITVFPFILRGVALIGIDSQNYPYDPRVEIWKKLGSVWKPDQINEMWEEITLEELDPRIDLILKGGVKGRVVVSLG